MTVSMPSVLSSAFTFAEERTSAVTSNVFALGCAKIAWRTDPPTNPTVHGNVIHIRSSIETDMCSPILRTGRANVEDRGFV